MCRHICAATMWVPAATSRSLPCLQPASLGVQLRAYRRLSGLWPHVAAQPVAADSSQRRCLVYLAASSALTLGRHAERVRCTLLRRRRRLGGEFSTARAATLGVATLGREAAAALDEDLMSTPGFSIDQLMELAGLSVASAVLEAFPPKGSRRALLVCGPGNNGGDGLVAARHLWHFGYTPVVVYPVRPARQLFTNLVVQCEQLGIPVLTGMPTSEEVTEGFDVAVDAIFGFSFKGTPRAPFDSILKTLRASSVKLVSVDIPSGWDVELGDVSGEGLRPDALVSLTAPKPCAADFSGRHFLGGRFVPPGIAEKYGLRLPPYPGAAQVVEL
ncbi:unnamed protein product [Polarella glacialis]|uniref:NAD(P)H-hydrate epimerase n=1 Tax=Polarella glacialis TaxID=89957 RepID=A0A813ENK1_POLGL|nr:unnamed protein product [Polarella glacialis]CAE8715620.1 unnamed protein product [Polarella glacialis]